MSIKDFITGGFYSLGYFVKKHAPEICLCSGIASILGGTGLAIKKTFEYEEIMDKHNERMNDIRDLLKKDTSYTEEAAKKDTTAVYLRTAGSTAKHYALSGALIFGGLGLIAEGFNILNDRYTRAIVWGNELSAFINMYRGRVREEFGDEYDRHFAYGTEIRTILDKEKKLSEITSDDIKNAKKDEVFVENECMPSLYARFFDIYNDNWCAEEKYGPGFMEFNLLFLHNQLTDANRLLNTRGYLFLNDVYKLLGLTPTTAGSIVGWVAKKHGGKDGYVDFGLYDITSDATRRFINGDEDKAILLDFNVDGPIYDKIDKLYPSDDYLWKVPGIKKIEF